MLVKRNTSHKGWIVASLALTLFTAGCTDNTQLKQDALQAATKSEQINSYRFNGSLELKADPTLLGQSSPIIATLFALLKDSKFEYSGLTALDSSRMESDVKVIPTGSNPVDIPILIKDSKLYFHMPPLNKPDEYMVLSIPSASKQTSSGGSPASEESLKHTGRLTSELNKKLWEGIDPKWLSSPKEPVALPDGTQGKKITLTINAGNEQAFSDYWNTAMPALIDSMKTNGLPSAALADTWSAALKQVKLKAPTAIEMVIDGQGFIREQRWDLTFVSGGSTNVNHIVWTQSLSELNQNPAFAKDVPAKQKSLEELLKLIKPAQAGQK